MSDRLPARASRKLADSGFPLVVRLPTGAPSASGPVTRCSRCGSTNQAGLEALGSLQELKVVEAYMNGDLDLDGDLFAAMDVRKVLSDASCSCGPGPSCSRRCRAPAAQPRVGRQALRQRQHPAVRRRPGLQVYTPGVFLDDDDTLEQAAERKLE